MNNNKEIKFDWIMPSEALPDQSEYYAGIKALNGHTGTYRSLPKYLIYHKVLGIILVVYSEKRWFEVNSYKAYGTQEIICWSHIPQPKIKK